MRVPKRKNNNILCTAKSLKYMTMRTDVKKNR